MDWEVCNVSNWSFSKNDASVNTSKYDPTVQLLIYSGSSWGVFFAWSTFSTWTLLDSAVFTVFLIFPLNLRHNHNLLWWDGLIILFLQEIYIVQDLTGFIFHYFALKTLINTFVGTFFLTIHIVNLLVLAYNVWFSKPCVCIIKQISLVLLFTWPLGGRLHCLPVKSFTSASFSHGQQYIHICWVSFGPIC